MAVLVASVNCILNPSKDQLAGESHRSPAWINKSPLVVYFSFLTICCILLHRDLPPRGEVPGRTDRERRQWSKGDEELDAEVFRRPQEISGSPGEDQGAKRGAKLYISFTFQQKPWLDSTTVSQWLMDLMSCLFTACNKWVS